MRRAVIISFATYASIAGALTLPTPMKEVLLQDASEVGIIISFPESPDESIRVNIDVSRIADCEVENVTLGMQRDGKAFWAVYAELAIKDGKAFFWADSEQIEIASISIGCKREIRTQAGDYFAGYYIKLTR